MKPIRPEQYRADSVRNVVPIDPHDECQRLYALSLSGDLNDEETKWFDEHLHACTPCMAVVEEYEQLVASLMPEETANDRDNRN